jgi:RimJ/RimL family protein N-acetyltransferase
VGLPTYRTERLVVRPRAVDDVASLLDLHQDAGVMRFLGGPVRDLVAHRQELQDRIARSWGEGLGTWSVVPHDDPARYLGWVLLIPIEGRGPDVEIGWRFARTAWGHGYATEAASRILRHGFEIARLDTIVAVIDRDNARSHRVAERIGLRRSGEREAYGKTMVNYCLSLDEFTANGAPSG